jgi:hypothetical protein
VGFRGAWKFLLTHHHAFHFLLVLFCFFALFLFSLLGGGTSKVLEPICYGKEIGLRKFCFWALMMDFFRDPLMGSYSFFFINSINFDRKTENEMYLCRGGSAWIVMNDK